MNIYFLILIGVSLSMDTFSLALSLGTFSLSKKKIISFSFLVGLFHFIMPILGHLLGSFINKIILFSSDKLLGIIFLFIGIEMLIDIFSKSEKISKINIISMIIYAFSVSLDAFTVGVGLNYLGLAPFIFAIISLIFTYMGLKLGNFAFDKIGKISKLIGLIIIILMIMLTFIN